MNGIAVSTDSPLPAHTGGVIWATQVSRPVSPVQ